MKIRIFIIIIGLSTHLFGQNDDLKKVQEQLFVIDNDDQNYRNEIDGLTERFGAQSKEVKDKWAIIQKIDSVNQIKVKEIINKYGWLGIDDIGSQCNSVLFMVIQHSDLKTQEYYLPIMREAVRQNKAKPNELALLEDRVAIRQKKKQIYGSQIGRDEKNLEYYVMPLIDPDNVDKRRAEVGLGPYANYLAHWNMKWDAEQYKKDIIIIESKLKSSSK